MPSHITLTHIFLLWIQENLSRQPGFIIYNTLWHYSQTHMNFQCEWKKRSILFYWTVLWTGPLFLVKYGCHKKKPVFLLYRKLTVIILTWATPAPHLFQIPGSWEWQWHCINRGSWCQHINLPSLIQRWWIFFSWVKKKLVVQISIFEFHGLTWRLNVACWLVLVQLMRWC